MAKAGLCASTFKYNKAFFDKGLELILCGIIDIYNDIFAKMIPLENDENAIRDVIFYEYLNNADYMRTHELLSRHHFVLDPKEQKGRPDIQVVPINPYKGPNCYYVIECKRLDNIRQSGKSGLNGEYIREGIDRFVRGKYPVYKNTAGMIGFVVTSMDIDDNIAKINQLLKNEFSTILTVMPITKKQLYQDFEYTYYSLHGDTENEKTLYHLMLDFSVNIF